MPKKPEPVSEETIHLRFTGIFFEIKTTPYGIPKTITEEAMHECLVAAEGTPKHEPLVWLVQTAMAEPGIWHDLSSRPVEPGQIQF